MHPYGVKRSSVIPIFLLPTIHPYRVKRHWGNDELFATNNAPLRGEMAVAFARLFALSLLSSEK